MVVCDRISSPQGLEGPHSFLALGVFNNPLIFVRYKYSMNFTKKELAQLIKEAEKNAIARFAFYLIKEGQPGDPMLKIILSYLLS